MLVDFSYIFDKLKDFYAFFSYYDKYGKAVLPFRYFLDITYRCNLECPYCYLGSEREKNELSTAEWQNIINQIPKYALISIIGGEPLLRKDFPDIFKAASVRTKNKIHICSNGLLLSEPVIDDFIKYKLLCLSVSLDGYGKIHDENRKCNGAFDKITENLDMVRQKSKNRHKILIDIKTILLENNLENLVDLYEFCSAKKYDFLSVALKRNNYLKQNPCLRTGFTEEFYAREYPFEQYFDLNKLKEVYKELIKISKYSKTKIRWAPKFRPNEDGIKQIEYLYNHVNSPVTDLYEPCLYPFSNLSISPEGVVYPCLSYAIGSLREHSLKEIINLPKYRCFRKNLKASKIFSSCRLCCEAYPKNKEKN